MSTQVKPGPIRASKRSHAGWWFLLVLVAIVGIGGGLWWDRGRQVNAAHKGSEAAAEEAAASKSPEGIRVDVVHPQQGGMPRLSTQTGSVHSFQQADLFAKVSGYLKWQEVDIGSRIKKGDLLAVIDDPEVLKEADRAAAALLQAKAMVAQAKAKIETAEADEKAFKAKVARAESDVASFTAKRKYREKEYARYKDLYANQAVQLQVVDEYQDHYESAIADERTSEVEVLNVKAQLLAAHAKVDSAKADLDEAKSNVDVTAAVLAKAQVLVDYTKITSPYDGVITHRNYFVGDFIRSATDGKELPLLTAARIDKMRVVTYVADRDVPYTDVGDKAVVTLDALRGRQFEGTVSRFSFTEEAQTRTMRTEIDLENPKGLLSDEMYGQATIILEADVANLTIPSGALVGKTESAEATVYVARDGRARQVKVTIGTDNGIRVEILKGLNRDDEVITSKGLVAEDAAVVPQRPETPAAGAGTH